MCVCVCVYVCLQALESVVERLLGEGVGCMFEYPAGCCLPPPLGLVSVPAPHAVLLCVCVHALPVSGSLHVVRTVPAASCASSTATQRWELQVVRICAALLYLASLLPHNPCTMFATGWPSPVTPPSPSPSPPPPAHWSLRPRCGLVAGVQLHRRGHGPLWPRPERGRARVHR